MNINVSPRQIQFPFGEGLSHPHVLILGLGESGLAMAKWAHYQGAQVRVHDTRQAESLSESAQKNIEQLKQLGVTAISFGPEITQEILRDVQLIGVSPGMSPLEEPIKGLIDAQMNSGYQIWGELEFFSRALESLKLHENYQPKVLGITGTNGKTTTTALTGVICERAGKHVAVAGNISPSLLDKLMMCLTNSVDTQEHLPEIWVLELSSFQLFYSQTFAPTAAVLLNITQDHFDWHGDFDHYRQSKAKIFGDNTVVILNRDDPKVIDLASDERFAKSRIVTFGMDAPFEIDSFGIVGDMAVGGFDWLAWVEPEIDFFPEEGVKRRRKKDVENVEPVRIKRLIPADALLIKGRHNAANALAALALAQSTGLSMGPLLHGLREYRGEPHRVQSVAIVRDVEYIDDSKGTNVGATIAALQGLGLAHGGDDHPRIIWIAGGEGKGQDFSLLSESVQRYAKVAILIGRDAPLIKSAIAQTNVPCIELHTLEDAVNYAHDHAVAGDLVLLSPACASFDMFKDYAHRAQVFVNAVEELTLRSHAEGVSV